MRLPLADVFRPSSVTVGTTSSTSETLSDGTRVPDVSSSYQHTSDLPSAAPSVAFNTIPFFYDALSELQTLGAVLFPSSPEGAAMPDFEQEIGLITLQRTAALNSRAGHTHRASMLADIENGRPMEIEVVLGELVRMGRAHGVNMPVSGQHS